MSVLVIGQNGRALMPTTTRKARLLLKENKASVKLAETLLIKVPGGQKEKWQDLAHFWWENQNFS